MKIQEIGSLNLNETVFKLSENSITAKVNNKTKAVINDVQLVSNLPFNRKVDLNVKFNSALNKFFDNLYIGLDSTLYYIIDQKYHEAVAKMANYGNDSELKEMMEKVNALSKLNVNVLFLNVA
ncbi:hypothetical protein [Paenibacillus naphthalenovorans]|uniref:Uncharacterized protein n=1 Tax=Paenibacillus naphthalenovorans TaxID=162209 RepID=A0A0U2KZ38_9BACL|nr:hypothetical protein [Paenibacillus naphthalenovorans]ALS22274.1 hypothetical protein IJ22_19000 [Paenibacillus naphthalenovorans]